MDFSYFENIMEPNDFVRLNKLDKYEPFLFIKKYPKIIDLMLEHLKANPKAINKYNEFIGFLVLIYAIEHNLPVKNICELNVNVNYCDKYDCTALAYATDYDNTDVFKILLEYDAATIIVEKKDKYVLTYGQSIDREKNRLIIENIRSLNIKN